MDLIKKVAAFFLDIVETIVVAMAIFVVTYLFLWQPHQVRGTSMEPSFFDKEYILTDKISYRFREPKRGEVIIFRAPKNQELDYIKRIIGLPGEKIKINTEGIFVNGQKLEESYLGESGITFSGPFLQLGQDLLVPQGEYFVLGDNRTHSSDSREWGTVSRPDIIGHAWMIYWPPKRFGIIKEIAY